MIPLWEKYVKWPACDNCRSTGVATDPGTQWPVECHRCKIGRVVSIARAKAAYAKDRAKARKTSTAVR